MTPSGPDENLQKSRIDRENRELIANLGAKKRETRGRMSDPQDDLKVWLTARLSEYGRGSCGALATHLGLTRDAVTRMKNRNGAKENRRILPSLIPKLAEFFGAWPPGFEPMDKTTEAIEKLADEAVKSAGRKKKPQQTTGKKDVVVQGVEGPVTVIDKSVNVLGDENTVAGSAPATLAPGAAELMGQVNEAIDAVYKSMKVKLTLVEMGRVALERHAAIMAACQDPEEYPHALEIMKLRLRRMLRAK